MYDGNAFAISRAADSLFWTAPESVADVSSAHEIGRLSCRHPGLSISALVMSWVLRGCILVVRMSSSMAEYALNNFGGSRPSVCRVKFSWRTFVGVPPIICRFASFRLLAVNVLWSGSCVNGHFRAW